MSGLWGGDVAAMRDLARSFDDSAEELDRVVAHLDSACQNMLWQGPDAYEFQSNYPSIRQMLVAAGSHLTTSAAVLRDNATAQEVVSQDTSSTEGSIDGGGGAGIAAGGIAMAAISFPMIGGTDNTPAVPPNVDNSELQRIIDEIYSGTKNPGAVGDGKLGTALLNEIATGQKTARKWHAVDSADQLSRLVNLLEADRKPNGNVSLSAADRAVALKEADELWNALNSPLSKDSPLYREIVNNPKAQQTLSAVERKMLTSPSVESITGTEFEQSHPKQAPRPKTAPRLGRVLGGVGGAFAIFDVLIMLRAAIDPHYAEELQCQMFPSLCLSPEIQQMA